MGNRNSVKLKLIRPGALKIGIGKGSFQMGENTTGYWNLIGDAKIVFEANFISSHEIVINCSCDELIEFGNGFSCNVKYIISCSKYIKFGENNLLRMECYSY